MRRFLLLLLVSACVICGYAGTENETANVSQLPIIVDMNDGLPGELSAIPGTSNYFVMDHKVRPTWESQVYNFEEKIDGIRLTVFDTRINESHNGYPMIAISELAFYDAEGEWISYSTSNVTTNSLETREGSLSFLNDGNVESFYHSIWSPSTYPKPESHVYLDVKFNKEVSSLKIVYTSRDYRHCPTIMGISKIGEKVEHPLWGYSGPSSTWHFHKETGLLEFKGEGAVRGGYGDTYLAMYSPWDFMANDIKDISLDEGIDNINLKLLGKTHWYRNTYKEWLATQNDGCIYFNNILVETKGLVPDNVVIPEGVKGIACGALKHYAISHLTLPSTLTSIEDSALFGSYIQEIIMPEGLKRIGCAAFQHSNYLEEAYIPGTVEVIGAKAFYSSNVKTVHFNEGTREIGDFAFALTWGITEVRLPSTIELVADAAFFDCYYIQSVFIPSNVRHLGIGAFRGCSEINSVYVMNETPIRIYDDTFDNYSATLYVPIGAKSAYEASSWGLFENIVEYDYTAIGGIECDKLPSNTYYDLNGRAVKTPEKGVYIKDGKKILF